MNFHVGVNIFMNQTPFCRRLTQTWRMWLTCVERRVERAFLAFALRSISFSSSRFGASYNLPTTHNTCNSALYYQQV